MADSYASPANALGDAAKRADSGVAIEENGFAILPRLFSEEYLDRLLQEMNELALRRSRAGVRHALGLPPVAALAREPQMMKLVQGILGPKAFPFRATLFDKSPAANWFVVWHQDTALPLRDRIETPGWGSVVNERRNSLRTRSSERAKSGRGTSCQLRRFDRRKRASAHSSRYPHVRCPDRRQSWGSCEPTSPRRLHCSERRASGHEAAAHSRIVKVALGNSPAGAAYRIRGVRFHRKASTVCYCLGQRDDLAIS